MVWFMTDQITFPVYILAQLAPYFVYFENFLMVDLLNQ